MLNLKAYYVGVCLFCATVCPGQSTTRSFYLPTSAEGLEELIEDKQDNYYDALKDSLGRRIARDFKDAIFQDYSKDLKEDYFNFRKDILDYVKPILKEVYKSNPELQGKNHLWLISNNPSPNASANGSGIFIINMGLLFTMENVEELAFVVCHEIAHYELEHSTSKIAKWSRKTKSDEFNDDLDEAKDNREVGSKLALALLEELRTDMLHHSKEKEGEADQRGYTYFKNTSYGLEHAASSLSKLLAHSERIKTRRIYLDSLLTTKEYPFKPYWIRQEVSLFSSNAEVNDYALASDSISTHPDLENRIARLTIGSDEDRFRESVKEKPHEPKLALNSIAALRELGKLDHALYILSDLFVDGKISKSDYYSSLHDILDKAIMLKTDHELGRHIPAGNSDAEFEDLNLIRVFFNNIGLAQLKKMKQSIESTYNLTK